MSGFKFVDALEQIPKLLPSTFSRASQAWDGTGLVPPDTMRVFGRDTKSPVVLIEGQRTNLVPNSNHLSEWAGDVGTISTANAGLAPDGTVTASKIEYDGSGTAGNIRVNQSVGTVPAGASRISSIWLRADSPTNVSIGHNTLSVTGTVLVTNEWKRFVSTAGVSEGSTASYQIQIRSPSGVNDAFEIYLWGAQVEAAPFPSSYIPTDGAPATRANEVFYLPHAFDVGNAPFTVHVAAYIRNDGRGQLANIVNLGQHPGVNINSLRLGFGISSEGIPFFYGIGVDGLPSTTNLGAVPTGWHLFTLSSSPAYTEVRLNGALGFSTNSPISTGFTVDRAELGDFLGSGADFALYDPIAPGAAQLGIPFIDTRAWSAAEIQAAHARWLPELQKIEVPV